mgnify:FL=1
MKNKKGFTLIELLAVIVVLAIIALIATPIVMNIIKSSKNSANKVSASNFASEANKYVMEQKVNGETASGNIFNEVSKRMNGKKPETGVVYSDDKGNIALALVFDDKCYTKEYDSNEIKTVDINECYAPVDFLALGSTENDLEATFFNGRIKKGSVEKIIFVNNTNVPTDAIGSWNASASGKGKVIAWYKDEDNNSLYEVYIGGNGGVKANPDSTKLFNYFSNLVSIDLKYLDTSSVTSMRLMFNHCSNLTELDVSKFDTSSVITMAGMFQRCSSLTTLDLSNFDTSKVTDMQNMFYYDSNLVTINLSSFNTSNVTAMTAMFSYCSNLTELDVSNFDTSKVTTMKSMFEECQKLTKLDVSNFNTSNVVDMSYMFNVCVGLTSIDVSNFDTSKVTDISRMFQWCNSLTELDLSNFDTSKVTDVTRMFNGNVKLTSINLSKATFNAVTKYDLMLASCGLTNVTVKDDDAKTFIDARLKEANINLESTKIG